MGPSARECPFDAETWSVNYGYIQISKLNGHLSKIFLAHRQVWKNGTRVFNWEAMNKLSELGVEIINTHKVNGLNSTLYPRGRISRKFGSSYFSDTICYMLAYAIDKVTIKEKGVVRLVEPFRIRLYGIDMRETGEYAFEKGGIEYWIGYARGLGIKVKNTKVSTICKTVTYKPYGDKALSPDKVFDGGRVIIGLEGTVYGKGNNENFRRSDYSLNEGQSQKGNK